MRKHADEIVTRMTVDLDNLIHNYEVVRRYVSPARLYAVVKSEAYGHGAVPVARALAGSGCRSFAVAAVDEGIQLRRAGIEGDILMMGATLPVQFGAMARKDITPVLPDLQRMQAWAKQAQKSQKRLPYHIKVDVGLGRMGFMPRAGKQAAEEAETLRENLHLVGIGSHLSHPSGSEEKNRTEQRRFERFCAPFEKRFPHIRRHLAASQAAARFEGMHYEMVRIGGLLYGFEHIKPSPVPLRAVMSLKTAVAQVKTLPSGWNIGYGEQHPVTEPTRVALLPLGWTDGLTSFHIGSTRLLVRGQPCTLVGVCTDFSMLDVSHLSEVQTGDEVVLVGCQGDRRITPIKLGQGAGISTGQLLGKLSIRVPRLYLSDGECVEELSVLNYQ